MFDKWRKLYKRRHQNIRLQKMLWIHQHQSDTLRRVSMFTLKIWTARREQINWASPLLHTPRSMVDHNWRHLPEPILFLQPSLGLGAGKTGMDLLHKSATNPRSASAVQPRLPVVTLGWTAHILQGAAAFVCRLKKWGKTERKQGAEDSLG